MTPLLAGRPPDRSRRSSPAIPKLLQVGGDGGVQLRGLGLLLAQRRGEPLHLLLERLAVVLLRLGADVAAGREDVAVLADLLERRALAEAGMSSYSPASFSPRQAWYVRAIVRSPSSVSSRWTRSTMRPSLRASMKSTSPRRSRKRPFFLFACEEPQADRDLRRVEELPRQRDHAVHEVRLDDVLADLALAGLVGGHGAVGEDEPGEARGRQVVDHVLHPGVVGVARGRRAVLPALVVPEPIAAPVAHVEGRIGEDEVGLEVGVAVVVEAVGVGRFCPSMPRMARFILASRQVVWFDSWP